MSPRADWSSTGNNALDIILGGRGLPRGTGLTIQGPSRSGKTALAMKMQFASMRRGEACLFISYHLPYYGVIKCFRSFGYNVIPYLKRGNLRILDNVLTVSDVDIDKHRRERMDDVLRQAVVLCDPRDQREYFTTQLRVIEGMLGRQLRPGINVIDSADYRVHLLHQLGTLPDPEISAYFLKFRVRLANELRFIGLHLYTPAPGDHSHAVLDNVEEGTIELKFEESGDIMNSDESMRFLRVVGLPRASHSREWHKFAITSHGIQIIP